MNYMQITLVVMIALGAGYFQSTMPELITTPHVPFDSPTKLLPPWVIFRPAIALNDFFHRMARLTTPPDVQVITMITAYWRSLSLHGIVHNGIVETLGGHSKKTCEEVANELQLIPHATCVLMHSAEQLGLLYKDRDNKYSLSNTGTLLLKDSQYSLYDLAVLGNQAYPDAYRAAVEKSIKTGKSGFEEAFNGDSAWDYYTKHPTERATFDRAMVSLGHTSIGGALSSLKVPNKSSVFCDIGGGIGGVLVEFLKHYPKSTGLILEKADTVKGANYNLVQQGLQERANAIAGDFFEPYVQDFAKCDFFLLKFILHDWADGDVVTILKQIKAIAKDGAQLVAIEQVLDTKMSQQMEISKSLLSLNMVAFGPMGSKERTLAELQALYTKAGIQGEARLITTRDIMSLAQATI